MLGLGDRPGEIGDGLPERRQFGGVGQRDRIVEAADRLAVERACGDLDKNAMFIPTLAPGQAMIVGPNLPAPMPVLIHEPHVPP